MWYMNDEWTRHSRKLWRLIVEADQTDRKSPAAKFAIDDDIACLIGHFRAILGRKFGDDVADMTGIATATLGHQLGRFDADFVFFVE